MHIPGYLYTQILKSVPIICVDGVILKDNKILLLKRGNEPEKNNWWFPGGRLNKNELLENAIIRKIKEETNLDVEIIKFIDFTQTMFKTGPSNVPVHTVNFTYLLKIIGSDLKINSDHLDFGWFEKQPKNLNPEVVRIINMVYGRI